MDRISVEQRSRVMAAIRGKDTGPELVVRRLLHGLGYRYRLHPRDVPGRPDIVLRSRRRAILINGCFWHQHAGCRLARQPKSRPEYWLPKLERNRQRDAQVLDRLHAEGWEAMVVWECEARSAGISAALTAFLGPPRREAVRP